MINPFQIYSLTFVCLLLGYVYLETKSLSAVQFLNLMKTFEKEIKKRRLYTRKKSRGKWENPFPSSELPPVQTKSKRKPKAAVASPPLPPKPPLLE